jgi:N-methylhydantoinase A
MPQFRLAVDTGGTFIDFVLLEEESGDILIEKEASTPDRLADQLIVGLRRYPVPASRLARFFHGTTVGINALVQERGARVGLITTAGFRDVLEIGRADRPDIYDFTMKRRPPLVPRYLRREVRERLSATGAVLTALDLKDLDEQVDALIAEDVATIAIAFLHAYVDPRHEVMARDHIRARFPHLPVSISSEIACEWREFERTSTTVLNAANQPLVSGYLRTLADKLRSEGYSRPIAIMQSNGGVCSAEVAAQKPIRTLMSGPAGGVIGAKFLSDALGYRNVISADVGGTTFDVALIQDGRILEKFESEIAGRPMLGSLIDVTSIGAGGGSIGWIDQRGTLRVGPQSAGARPGPACFGLGGTQATVTDAQLALGWLDAKNFLGGRMQLDTGAARDALGALARPLGQTVEAIAAGMIVLAATGMSNAIRRKTIERGLDPREFVMLAYGGGGALFAAMLCEELGMHTAVVPRLAANFSAWGILTSDYVEDASRTSSRLLDAHALASVRPLLEELQSETVSALVGYGFTPDRIETSYRVDVRFVGQAFAITVPLDPTALASPAVFVERIRSEFVKAHRQLYGHGDDTMACQISTLRCRSIGRVRIPPLPRVTQGGAGRPRNARTIRLAPGGEPMRAEVYERADLNPGFVLQGPAIVEEWTTTCFIPPGWRATLDEFGNLLLTDRGPRQVAP